MIFGPESTIDKWHGRGSRDKHREGKVKKSRRGGQDGDKSEDSGEKGRDRKSKPRAKRDDWTLR